MKQPTPKDAIIIEAITRTSERVGTTAPDFSEFVNNLRDRTETYKSLGEMGVTDPFERIEYAKRYLKLRSLANRQVPAIMHGCSQV